MKIFKNYKNLKNELKRKRGNIGFVPTMGALHNGHVSLIKKSVKENDITVVSIFLNPIQFNSKKDLEKYPSDLSRDIKICKSEKVDYVYCPDKKSMYNNNYQTYVYNDKLGRTAEGKFRPGHFEGVCTVVAKLLNAVTPDRLYLGQKDYQQYLILTKMIQDLDYNIKSVRCPIIREKNGLAMSSRNKLLSQKGFEIAANIYAGLKMVKKDNIKLAVSLKKKLYGFYKKSGLNKIEYIEIRNRKTLLEMKKIVKGRTIVLVAVWVDGVRLIDNIMI